MFYVLHESFENLILQYPKLLDQVAKDQLEMMIEPIDAYDIMASAVSYFQSDIVMENDVLFMKNTLTQECSCIECKKDYILFHSESNPFLPLLKRKYRRFLIKDFDLI